jgi:hypothetical protein
VSRAGARPAELVAALLRELRATPGTLLVLEDLHWADEGTLDALRLLGRRIDGVPSLAVATFRDDAEHRAPGRLAPHRRPPRVGDPVQARRAE